MAARPALADCPGGNCRAPLMQQQNGVLTPVGLPGYPAPYPAAYPPGYAPSAPNYASAGPLALGTPPAAAGAQRPHPAVARIIAVDRDGMSLGSGTLVYVTDKHGLVITNWHVVRDAVGPIEAVFPDGFHSLGTVIKVDKAWDLAAIGIWKPPATPVQLSPVGPQQGEPLTIAGYGGGSYRAATGRLAGRSSPGANYPLEFIELGGVEARQGDSGGPIFNQRGQMAGVLFGAGSGMTLGSYCGRVGIFLSDVTPLIDKQSSGGGSELIAASSASSTAASNTAASNTTALSNDGWRSAGGAAVATNVEPGPPPDARAIAIDGPAPAIGRVRSPRSGARPATYPRDVGGDRLAANDQAAAMVDAPWNSGNPRGAVAASVAGRDAKDSSIRWEDVVGHSRGEQAKSILAAIGALAILLATTKVLLAA
ncbi:MAG: serine protease [Planctomycetia bacterium]|nr:serine protease [Planctomycetia bacterium]